MSKSVLVETSLFQPISSLVESRSTGGNMVVEGILTTVNQENGNSRVKIQKNFGSVRWINILNSSKKTEH